jgi:TrmH family RNA methyltransferase
VRTCPWDEIRRLVQAAGLRVYLAAAGDGLPYTQADFRSPLVLVVGGEAEGAGSEARALAHQRVSIPMPGGIESLNAAAAAAILLFEVVRQRKEKSV